MLCHSGGQVWEEKTRDSYRCSQKRGLFRHFVCLILNMATECPCLNTALSHSSCVLGHGGHCQLVALALLFSDTWMSNGGSVGVNELFSHMCFCFNTFVSCFSDTMACGMISAPLVTAGTIKGLLLTGPGQLTPVFLLCHTVMVSIDRQLARIENPREDRRTSGRDCEGFSRLG